jgi:hypothetical protein
MAVGNVFAEETLGPYASLRNSNRPQVCSFRQHPLVEFFERRPSLSAKSRASSDNSAKAGATVEQSGNGFARPGSKSVVMSVLV